VVFVWYDKSVVLTFKEEHKLDQSIKIFREVSGYKRDNWAICGLFKDNETRNFGSKRHAV